MAKIWKKNKRRPTLIWISIVLHVVINYNGKILGLNLVKIISNMNDIYIVVF